MARQVESPPRDARLSLTTSGDLQSVTAEDGLAVEDFEHFGPVQLFRSSFINSWKRVLAVIQERRARLREGRKQISSNPNQPGARR